MRTLFGTDGIRGNADRDLPSDLVLAIGRAAAAQLVHGSDHPKIIIGRDTRMSSLAIENVLARGLVTGGADVVRCGVLPTPGVAFLVADIGAAAGAVISASHNPYEDNGIKFFGPGGFKLPDDVELAIEKLIAAESYPDGIEAGSDNELADASGRYVAQALASLEAVSLGGMKIVVDCANGAAYKTTPAALEKAGAEVIVINDVPDGRNINHGCGSTHPEAVARVVLEVGADVGIAHDGDADRVIAVDEKGKVVDGDAMIAALAIDMSRRKALKGDQVVVTVMANTGFRKAMREHGIRMVETPVGDRYVLEAMLREDANLGGEQSGHVIFTDFATTGDGLITALRFLALASTSGKKLSQLNQVIDRYPQVLLNVKVSGSRKLEDSALVKAAIDEASSKLGEAGRVLVRASGTEPLVRVMVEAAEQAEATSHAERIADVVRTELG